MGGRRLMKASPYHAVSICICCWTYFVRNCNCQSVDTVNQHADVTGVQPCTIPWESPLDSMAFHLPLLYHQSAIQIQASPLPLLQKICISCTNWKAKHPSGRALNYPVGISLVTETHVSVHILHNLLVVPVQVKCSTACASQHFTHL